MKDGSKKPAEGAIVYVEKVDPAAWRGHSAPKPKVAMKDKKFDPRVVPVLAGQSVPFANMDPIFHNVFSLSPNNKFDLGLYKDGKSKAQEFTTPGVVRVFCNIHPSMSAYVLVVQNPYFASVGADGAYRLPDIPAGTWNLKVWHEKGGESSRSITVTTGQRASADFELDASKFKVLPHKNKFGQDYSNDAY